MPRRRRQPKKSFAEKMAALVFTLIGMVVAYIVAVNWFSSALGIDQNDTGSSDTPAIGIVQEGNPATGELPLREDGSIVYASVTSEYPQGQAFIAAFRAIFTDFGDEHFTDTGDSGTGDNALRSVQEICGSIHFGQEPSDQVRTVALRIGQDFPREPTEAEAVAVINAAIDTVCPEYAELKL